MCRQESRPEPVSPSDVRVGDVVEIEADNGSWMVRGAVDAVGASGYDLCILPGPGWVNTTANAPVRVLHAAEPEPDEAAVEALADVFRDVLIRSRPGVGLDEEWVERHARELVKRNVRVVSTDE